MKTIQINTVSGEGSTGKICVSISEKLNNEKIDNYILYCTGHNKYSYAIKYGFYNVKIDALLSKIRGNYGFNSKQLTKKLLKQIDCIKPDIVHLHNIHGHNCNLEMLFNYLKKNRIKILWTFHDCWAFTAYCPYYDMVKCEKWKKGCANCIQRRRFSWLWDRSKWLYEKKRELFANLEMTIVTPSKWLAEQTAESFLKDYSIRVINNGINLSLFQPLKSCFRETHRISQKKYIILGVAHMWVPRKGSDIFCELFKLLDEEKYQIVLVGKNFKANKDISSKIIWIPQTANQEQLAEIYSAADLFVNPTREENYPTVNMEALACGTPVVTFNTGGSPEMLNEKVGSVVERDDIDALEKEIIRICEEKPYSREDCIEHAKNFDMNMKYMEYVELYKELLCK